MDEENPALEGLINPALPASSALHTAQNIQRMREYYSRLTRESENIQVRAIRRGLPHLNLVVTDACSVAVLTLYSVRYDYSPLWQCPSDAPLYGSLAEEFEALWQANAPDALAASMPRVRVRPQTTADSVGPRRRGRAPAQL